MIFDSSLISQFLPPLIMVLFFAAIVKQILSVSTAVKDITKRKTLIDDDEQVLFELNEIQVSYYRPFVYGFGLRLFNYYYKPWKPDNVLITTKRIIISGDFFGTSRYFNSGYYPYRGILENGKQIIGPWGYIESFTLEEENGESYLFMQMSEKRWKYKIYTPEAKQIYAQLEKRKLV